MFGVLWWEVFFFLHVHKGKKRSLGEMGGALFNVFFVGDILLGERLYKGRCSMGCLNGCVND